MSIRPSAAPLTQRASVFLPLALTVTVLAVGGCTDHRGVRTYRTPKEEVQRPRPVRPAASPSSPSRMIASIIPVDERAWFFKLVGPPQRVGEVADHLEQFWKTIRFGDDGQPTWTVPEDWQQVPGNQMRFATLLTPGSPPLELSVSSLVIRGDVTNYVLQNVNRWRGQIGLPPTTETTLSSAVATGKLDERDAYFVDMVGPPAGAAPGGAADPSQYDVGFQTPDGWKPEPAGSLTRYAFGVVEDDAQAKFTISDFDSAAPSISSPLANVNRWRRQLSLPSVDREGLLAGLERVRIGEQDGVMVELFSPDTQPPARGTLAAMSEFGGRIWFFKLSGDRSVVESQKTSFLAFLETVEFTTSKGDRDGDK